MTVHTAFRLFALLWIVLTGVKALPIKSCTDDQYKRILHNGSFVCIDCLRCPMGLGPSVECGSTISAETKIHCEICKTGVSFSPYNDFEQCQSCSVCSEDQVSKPCTSSSDTRCEKRCKSKGKYYEKSSDDCQDCTWCCEDGHDIVIDECLKKGMPAQKSCTVHRKKLCKPPAPIATTARPLTALLTTLPPTTNTTQSITDPWKTTEKELTNAISTKEPSNKTFEQYRSHSSSLKSAITTERQVLIGVCVGLGVLSAASLACLLIIYRKKCSKLCTSSAESQENLEVIYRTKEDEDSIIATYKESRLFEIFEKNHQLKAVVCNKLDLQKSYSRLARCCKMHEDKVRKLEEHPENEPACKVLEWIESTEPGFLFGKFANILKEIERNDVLKCCVEKLSKEIHVELN